MIGSAQYLAQELASWQRARRYGVPRWMIERATERRLAGDWEGACRAARVRVALDLEAVAGEHGAEVAGALLEDLRHLAPDLLRWHLPRIGHGRSTLRPHQAIVLARHGGRALHVLTPTMMDGPQHLVLRFGDVDEGAGEQSQREEQDWTGARYLWDARHAGELLERCGGGGRVPFFHADGTPLTDEELAGDGAGLAERVVLLQERGEVEAAFDAAGFDLDLTAPDLPAYYNAEPRPLLSWLPLALTRLGPEIARLGGDRHEIFAGWPAAVRIEGGRAGGRPLVKVVDSRAAGRAAFLPDPAWRRLPDLDLLRAGRIGPDELHPLVRSAVFPARPEPAGPSGPPDAGLFGAPVRVRCRGEWHEVRQHDGALRIPHGDEERRREKALLALGGAVSGCFALERAWTGGGGRLPKALRDQRQELFLRAQHGDTPGVLRLLDDGADPHARDGRRRTLLHLLHMLDHEELLPRLLKAGLDLEARDQNGRTPLHMAVGDHGPESLVRALVDAGARIDVEDELTFGLVDFLDRHDRTDLDWLRERIKKECPGVGGAWWSGEDYE
ncbi:ankyrin repeat domain-containing protein [Actinomadura viridis]|uniref:ankyrin repeat domain-containing protein n=1 Tax=Actinomadura viridis TaxID=58110 RepID=UPI00369E0CFC